MNTIHVENIMNKLVTSGYAGKISIIPGRILCFLAVLIFSGQCAAQERPYADTVTGRQRPELDPLGMRTAGFSLFPSVDLTARADDNIFAKDSQEQDDVISIIEPEISIRSNWNVHALNVRLGSSIGRYADNSDENYEDYNIGVNGEIDILHATRLRLAAGYAQGHVDRNSPNDIDGIEPTILDIATVSAVFEHTINRITAHLGATVERRDYDDVDGATGRINNDDQDRDEASADVRLSYELYPYNEAFIRFAVDKTDYDQRLDDNGVNRSAEDYRIEIGSDFRLSGIIIGDFFIGRLYREFDGASLEAIEAFTAGGELAWIATGLTTVNLSLLREIQETVVGTSSGILVTEAELAVDHELLRNVLLAANAVFRKDDFKSSSREDDYHKYGLGVTYMMNRNLYLSLNYDFVDRDSSSAGGVDDFTNNRISLTLRLQK